MCDVTNQLNVPTSMTPVPSHLLRFDLARCAKEVSDLISHPVVSFFGSGTVGNTGANMISKSVKNKNFANTNRERQIRQCCYFRTNTSGEERLSETSRPGLISVMRPDPTHPTHEGIPKDSFRDILFIFKRCLVSHVVYYQSIKRELKINPMY